PTFDLMKGSCKSLIELEYHLEEVYKATTDQLDWVNPEGQQYPHNLLQPLPLIPNNRGRRVIPFEHFINNDLEYLRGGASSRKYTTSITKTKAADYGHIKWIEDLVPRTMWIQETIGYDKNALWEVSHWGRKRAWKGSLEEGCTRKTSGYYKGPYDLSYAAPILQEITYPLRADDISRNVKLKDLADILKDTRFSFFTPDTLTDEPIIVSYSQKKELEQENVTAEAKAASIKAKPSYPDINQLTKLLVTSLKRKLSKLLASHDFASCLPTELKELPSKIIGLYGEIKKLKQHIKEMKIELPGDLNEIPSKLKTFTSTISNLSSQVAELKNIQWELPAEFLDFPHLASSMKKRRQSSKIINCDVLTKKGPISLKVYREEETSEVIEKFKASDLQLAEWREIVQACPDRK
nr:hypothetical protein [Tanacetum cinerariifolium]